MAALFQEHVESVESLVIELKNMHIDILSRHFHYTIYQCLFILLLLCVFDCDRCSNCLTKVSDGLEMC